MQQASAHLTFQMTILENMLILSIDKLRFSVPDTFSRKTNRQHNNKVRHKPIASLPVFFHSNTADYPNTTSKLLTQCENKANHNVGIPYIFLLFCISFVHIFIPHSISFYLF